MKKIQGNQPLGLDLGTICLSKALDDHFSNSNCDGVLVSEGQVCNYRSLAHQFVCRKCSTVIRIGDLL